MAFDVNNTRIEMIKEKFLNLMTKYSDNEKYNLECWSEIEKHYTSKSRHYHNLEHLENMLIELENVKSQIRNLDTLLFSIYYHDIVYKATRSDNEHQSAIVFEKRINKTSFDGIIDCMNQIEATKEHKHSTDNDTNILLDLDLSVLGKSTEEYSKYSKNIRKEYRVYPDFMYRKGRKKALKNIIELNSIFKTDYFISKYESQAKENLKFELEQLS
ncbi:hypothetical protein [Algibacter amylolyticus]|nr:hypothetical protein [Algibacter amylolyticus]MBB5267047.1 putative metal-dependent HD superfamily phosphohydrolase [Algibacter amylolyticus]